MIVVPFVQGFSLGASLIMAIGAQNVWVLKRGIARNHHIFTATVCVLCDVALIFLGVFGAGALLSANESVLTFITAGGVIFLTWYGFTALRSAIKPAAGLVISEEENYSLRKVLISTLAFTLLNPHVYLDTMVILGSIGGQFYDTERVLFALGTMLASIVWFYGLATTAARLAPALSRPRVRQVIDFLVCLIMWSLALMLVIKEF